MKGFHVHATCVAVGGHGVLIRGKPGSGKSELALRLIDAPGYGSGNDIWTGVLVADDQTHILLRDGKLFASPPPALAGLLELRGQGILTLPQRSPVAVALVVDLMADHEIERMPEDHEMTTELAGIALPRIQLDQAQPAAPAIVRTILTARLKLLPRGLQWA